MAKRRGSVPFVLVLFVIVYFASLLLQSLYFISHTGCDPPTGLISPSVEVSRIDLQGNNSTDIRVVRPAKARFENTEPYDIVTLVHHDDMDNFLFYALRSWTIYLSDLSGDANIYLICTEQAFEAVKFHLEQEMAAGHTARIDHIIPVRETAFPFSLADTTHEKTWAKKPTWVYQQLLKLYAFSVLSTDKIPGVPRIKKWFAIIDADTTFVRQTSMFSNGVPVYNFASVASGAFFNDCNLGDQLIKEVFRGLKMKKAFPDRRGNKFTAITHIMTMNGPILKDMMAKIEEVHGKKAWKVLCKLNSVLSEWELYMAWAMAFHRDKLIVRQTPYVNWGLLDHANLRLLHNNSDVVYLSKHDDYEKKNRCCVNVAHWDKKNMGYDCGCCQPGECKREIIDCKNLGLDGCRNVDDEIGTGMRFSTK